MPRRRPVITLTPEQHTALAAMQRMTSRIDAATACRARAILLVADGESISNVAFKCGVAPYQISRWARAWNKRGMAVVFGRR
jgi:transposase